MGGGCHRNEDVSGLGVSPVDYIVKLRMWVHVKGLQASGAPSPNQASRSSFPYSGPGCSFVPPVSCSPLGQSHDTIRFRLLLCPDSSCEVCNNATAEMDQLFSEALEDATPSVSPLAPAAPVTESSFTLSPAFTAIPPGDAIPPPLPEPFPLPPSKLFPNPVTRLGDFPSPSVHTLPLEPFPLLESEFPVDGSPLPPLAFPSLPPHDTQSVGSTLTLKTIFLDPCITQDINPFPDLAQTLNSTALVTYGPSIVSVLPPPDYSLTEIQHKSITISPKPALENSSPDSTGALSTHVLQGIDHPSLSISDLSCKDAHVKDPLLSTLAQCDVNQVKNVGFDAEKDLNSYILNLSGVISMVSGQRVSQRQSENALKEHLNKKFKEINEGLLPVAVHCSLHAIQRTLSVQSHTKIKQRSLAPSVGGEKCLNTSLELSVLESSAQQMLEAHITKFHMRRMCDLPTKVLESIRIFKSKDTSSHSLSDPKSSSSTNVISELVSKSGGIMPLRESSKTLNHPRPASSLVGKEGQGTLRRSPPDIAHVLAEEVQRSQDARQTPLPVTNSIIDKESERHSPIANIGPPKLPTKQARAGHEPKDQCVNSSQGQKMKKLEPVFMPNVSRVGELDALQSKMSDVLTTSKLGGISQRINVNESKVVTTVTTESLPAKKSALQGPRSEDLHTQVMAELKCKVEKMQSRTRLSRASDILTNKAALTHAQGVSSVGRAAPQELHVQFEDRGVCMEQPQVPWIPKNLSRLSQDKNFPPAAKKVRPTGSKTKELGGGKAGLGTSQHGRNRFPTWKAPLKERLGTKFTQTPSQKAQSPPESLFRNQMNRFFQWLHPGTKCKKQESSQEKSSPISSVQSRGPVKSRAAFTGLFREEKLGRRHAVDVTCPQEPLPSAVKSGKAQQKAGVRAQAEPVQGHPSNSRAPSCKVTNTKSFCQEAVSWKVRALKDQLFCQKHPQSVPCRGTMPCPRPTWRPPAARAPPAVLTKAGGIVEINLYYLNSKHFCRISREIIYPTPK